MLAYLNGRFLPQEEARLSLHDAGFVFGATVTDLCRTFRHRLFRLPDHVARFRQSCELARIPQPVPDQEITRLAEELAAKNSAHFRPEEDFALVMFATPGPIGYYATSTSHSPGGERAGGEEENDSPPTLGMHMFPLPLSRYASLVWRGAHLAVPTTLQAPRTCIDPRIKHRSRLHWWIAGREAQQVEQDAWALLLDADGNVTETAAANFLVVKNGIVYTPPRTTVLGGISLSAVEEICQDIGIHFQEQAIALKDCLEADEALLTGTSFCLAGVSRIGAAPIPWPGKILEKLLQAWNQRVDLDIRAQILSGGE